MYVLVPGVAVGLLEWECRGALELRVWEFRGGFEELLLPQCPSPWAGRAGCSWPAACSGELAAARSFLQSAGRCVSVCVYGYGSGRL